MFKQKDRYKAHIETKHAEEAAAAAAEEAEAAAAAAAQAQAAGEKGGMMKAGSRAGAYTCKGPHLMLLEHCRADGRVKPRVKVQACVHLLQQQVQSFAAG